jgi:type I restriction enzyme R subunit
LPAPGNGSPASANRASAAEGLREDELALFDLLQKDGLDKTARERVKQASRELLASIKARLAELDRFWEKEQTKADVEVFILDEVFGRLPTPPFTAEEKKPETSMLMSGSRR